MEENLRALLTGLGIPPVITAAVVLLAVILVFFVKRVLDQREKQQDYRRGTLRQYLLDREQGLLKAYRMLYEEKNILQISPKELVEIICKADESIMEPFTRYRAELPADVKNKIYNDIHSILAQFKPDPTSSYSVTPDAVRNLIRYRETFLRQIESVKLVVEKYL